MITDKNKETNKQNNNDNILHLTIPEEFEKTIFIQNNIPKPPRAKPRHKSFWDIFGEF